MQLWIAEKPDMGRKVAKALGGGQERNGAIDVGNGHIVTWAIGHLLEQFMPHDYDEKYRKWNMGDLPIIPKRFQNKPQPGKESQLRTVVGLIKKAKSVVIATDAGREGEAIAWTLLDHAGWNRGAQRLWTSSLGEDHLKKEVRKLIDDSQKRSLYDAAKLRSAMDWSDGINYSRLYNLRLNAFGDKPLSLGRVQTATLAILVDRDNEITNFKPENYFELTAPISVASGTFELKHQPAEKHRIQDQKKAEDLAQKASNQDCILKVETKPVTMRPPIPFSLPELQMACSSKWGWSAKRTLDETQKLYEAGLVTYPRTDTGCLTNDMKKEIPSHLASLQKHPDFKELARIKPILRAYVFDESKIEDHHGIIPTDQVCNPAKLDPASKRLYDLIARRFLASLMPDAEGRRTVISTSLAGLLFKTSGTIIDKQGWKAVWKNDEKQDNAPEDDENKELPPVSNGEKGRSLDVKVDKKTTKPPAHYTEGTLLKAMLHAGSKDPDAEVRELMSGGGLGTQATRQEIIEKLKFRDFARIEGKKIISTERARVFVAILREESSRLVDVAATADLEKRLREVEKDPAKIPDIWREYIRGLRSDIESLKGKRASRKLPPSQPDNKQASNSSRKTSSRKKAPAQKPGKPSKTYSGKKRATSRKPK